jgi:hypothetical protein
MDEYTTLGGLGKPSNSLVSTILCSVVPDLSSTYIGSPVCLASLVRHTQ